MINPYFFFNVDGLFVCMNVNRNTWCSYCFFFEDFRTYILDSGPVSMPGFIRHFSPCTPCRYDRQRTD